MNKCPFIRAKCPQSPDGCPCWHTVVMENPQGETKVVNDCLFRLLPLFMTEMIRSANAPAAAIESMRNQVVDGLGAIATGVYRIESDSSQRITHDG